MIFDHLPPHLKNSADTLLEFIKNPVHEIQKLPEWEWRQLILTQAIASAICGALAAVLRLSLGAFFFQIFLTPVLMIILTSVSCLFFYYMFQIFANTTIPFRALYQVVFFANIPMLIMQILLAYFPPIILFGMAFSGLLLIVAFVENFKMPRKLVIRLIAGIYGLIFLVWLFGELEARHIDKSF